MNTIAEIKTHHADEITGTAAVMLGDCPESGAISRDILAGAIKAAFIAGVCAEILNPFEFKYDRPPLNPDA